jgi:transposase InsO family protein
MRLRIVDLNEREKFKLKVMDAHRNMDPKNVRYLCRLFGIGKSTFYRWRKTYKPYNLTTLKYKSRRPRRFKTIPWDVVVEICEWKRNHPKKSHYYLYQTWIKQGRVPPCSSKTIYNWWKRRGLIVSTKYKKRKRRSTKLFNKAKLPGELVQMDVKYVGGRKRFQYTAIDVVSKWRYLHAYPKFNQVNSIDFTNRLTRKAREKDITIARIQTDNGGEFQSEFVKHLSSIGIKHQYIWVRTPDMNGCVERSHRTDDEEFYQETDTRYLSLDQLNQKLEEWINYYNTKRLHFSLNFDTPEEYLEKHRVSHK